MSFHGIQTPDPPRSVPQLPGYPPEEHLASLVGYLECPLGEPLGFAQELLPGWQDCSELGDSLRRQDCSELGDSLRRQDYLELGHSPEHVGPALASQG